MRNLTSFINESVTTTDIFKESTKIANFLNAKISQSYIDIDGQNFTNSTGNYFGFLFVSKKDGSAIRINWEGQKFHSISFWLNWNYSEDPAKEIFIEDAIPGKSSFSRILPDIAAIINDINSFDNEQDKIDESMLSEHKVEYDGKVYLNKRDLVTKLYEDDLSIRDISRITNLTKEQIKSIVTKYLFKKGGSVYDISDAVGEENNVVRKYVNSSDAEDLSIEYDDSISVVDGLKETIVSSKAVKTGQSKLDDTEYADPDMVFELISEYVMMISKRLLPSVAVTSQGVIGKYFNAEKELNNYGKINEDWIRAKGKLSTEEIYEILWNNRNKIVLFEDCDSIFKDPDSIKYIKTVLDDTGDRDVEWIGPTRSIIDVSDLEDNLEIESRCENWSEENKGKDILPSHFKFEGQVILLSELTKKELLEKEPTILDNCTNIDIIETAKNSLMKLETILPHLKFYKTLDSKGSVVKDITLDDVKQDVFNFINSDAFLKNPKIRGKEITYRIFDEVYKLRYAELDNWKDIAIYAGV